MKFMEIKIITTDDKPENVIDLQEGFGFEIALWLMRNGYSVRREVMHEHTKVFLSRVSNEKFLKAHNAVDPNGVPIYYTLSNDDIFAEDWVLHND